MADQFEIPDVDLGQVDSLLVKLKSDGHNAIPILRNRWQVTGHGIDCIAEFMPLRNSLMVTVKHKPLYVRVDRIREGIIEALDGSAKK